jgi:hypothetical protein
VAGRFRVKTNRAEPSAFFKAVGSALFRVSKEMDIFENGF